MREFLDSTNHSNDQRLESPKLPSRYLPALIAISEQRIAELAAACQSGTVNDEISHELARWSCTLASLKAKLERPERNCWQAIRKLFSTAAAHF